MVWAYFIGCFFLQPRSHIYTGRFFDPDDPMVLTQIMDWLKGQSWFDLSQYRMDPPGGTLFPISRFSEAPVAALIILFQFLGMTVKTAIFSASIIWPAFLYGVLLLTFVWVARAFMPAISARLTPFVALFAIDMNVQFIPTHVDHHNGAIVLTLAAIGAIARLLGKPLSGKLALISGLLLGGSLGISLEVLPWFLLLNGVVCVWLAVKGEKAGLSGLVFGGSVFGTCLLFLLVTRRPIEWASPDLMQYSITYVLLAAGVAFCACVAFFCRKISSLSIRLFVLVLCVCAASILFLKAFPALEAGPYGEMNERTAKLFFNNIIEALPYYKREPSLLKFFIIFLYPFLGIGCAIYFFYLGHRNRVWKWGILALLVVVACLLTIFYQSRYTAFLSAFAVVPLTAMLAFGLKKIRQKYSGNKLVYAQTFLVLMAGLFPSVLAPTFVVDRQLVSDILLFPVHVLKNRCDYDEMIKKLNEIYPDQSRIIINLFNEGPELLFRTSHKVLGGLYHYNVRGNLNVFRFFSTHYPDVARKIAAQRNVDLVVACRDYSPLYLPNGQPRKHEITKVADLPGNSAFIEQLMIGQVPAWLRAIVNQPQYNFIIYETVPEMLAQKN